MPVILVVTVFGCGQPLLVHPQLVRGLHSVHAYSLSCAAVGLQFEDVWPGACLEVEGRHVDVNKFSTSDEAGEEQPEQSSQQQPS